MIDKNSDQSECKLRIEGSISKNHIDEFSKYPHFDEIYIRNEKLITERVAKKFNTIHSVHSMELWCDITRAAARYVISLPNLQKLFIFGLKPPGKLAGCKDAECLTDLRCDFDLREADLIELAKLPVLTTLGAQYAEITVKALELLLEMPSLTSLDFESSNFNDEFAYVVSQSKRITKLEIGGTEITRKGLKNICSMKQLKELDIWATSTGEQEIDMLSSLPNLEYLSIGGHEEQTKFTAEGTLPRLQKIKSLKRIWLDGLRVTKDEWEYLNSRYEHVRVTEVLD